MLNESMFTVPWTYPQHDDDADLGTYIVEPQGDMHLLTPHGDEQAEDSHLHSIHFGQEMFAHGLF